MYQVSERVKKQFEYTMSIPCVKAVSYTHLQQQLIYKAGIG